MIEFIQTVKYYLKIFQYYLGIKMYYIFFLVFIAALAESIGIIMLIPLFEGIDTNSADDPKNIISGFVKKILIQFGIGENIETILLVICIVFIIKGFVMFLMLAYDAFLRSRLISLLRLNLYKLCENMDYEYYITKNTGYFVNILSTQIKKALDSFDSLSSFVTQTIFAFVYLTLSFIISWRFGIMALLIGSLLFVLFKFLNRYVILLSRKVSSEEGILTKLIIQTLQSFKYLTSTNQGSKLNFKTFNSINNLADLQKKSGFAYAFTSSVREPIAVSSIILIMIVQVSFFDQEIAPILISVMLFYRGVNSILGIQSSWQRTLETIGSIELVHEEFSSQKLNQSEDGKIVVSDFRGSIEFKNTKFAFKSNSVEILRNLNFKIFARKSYAFIGKSGSGKSTILDLITLMIRPSSGEILIDGKSSKKISAFSWRNQIGFVSQDDVIFDDSIANNISMNFNSNKKNKNIINRIEIAARKANIYEFIQSLDDGFDTQVGERGVNLSGGQKQRIFIARELFREPNILMLDEATSALDTESELEIKKSIDSLKGTMTLIIVAHRLSSIQNVDSVFVLEHGQIIEKGSYKSLKADPNSYLSRLAGYQDL